MGSLFGSADAHPLSGAIFPADARSCNGAYSTGAGKPSFCPGVCRGPWANTNCLLLDSRPPLPIPSVHSRWHHKSLSVPPVPKGNPTTLQKILFWWYHRSLPDRNNSDSEYRQRSLLHRANGKRWRYPHTRVPG